jgi:hypothetical protein
MMAAQKTRWRVEAMADMARAMLALVPVFAPTVALLAVLLVAGLARFFKT